MLSYNTLICLLLYFFRVYAIYKHWFVTFYTVLYTFEDIIVFCELSYLFETAFFAFNYTDYVWFRRLLGYAESLHESG